MPVEPVVRVLPDAEAISVAAAELVIASARDAQEARGVFLLVLAGGSTPRRLYERLAAPPFREQVDWTRVEFFWGDERGVAPDHPDSNYRMARETLLDPLGIPPGQVHRMPAEREDRDAAARAYELTLRRFASPDDLRLRFDLVLLGVGADGHTASLFPGTPALEERDRSVVAQHVATLGWRMTLTPPVLNAARSVVFQVTGREKAAAVADALSNRSAGLPVQRVRPVEGELIWLVDRESAGRLSE